MINTESDQLLSLNEAARACPSVDGKKPHCSTLWRWMQKGVRGVRLEHVKIGRRIVTTRHSLETFFRELADAPMPSPTPAPTAPRGRTSKQRERDLAAARATLADHGIVVRGRGQ